MNLVTVPDLAPSPARNCWPLRLLLGTLVLSIGALALCAWQIITSLHALHDATDHQHRIEAAAASALFHHEVMSASAQMFMLNDMRAWQKRYDIAQQQLGQDLIDLRLMTPETISPLNAVVEEAGNRLVKREAEAFKVMRDGDRLAALSLLANNDYRLAKDHFATSLMTLGQNLGDLSKARQERLHVGLRWRWHAMAVVLVILGCVWMACLSLIRSWQKKVDAAAEHQRHVETRLAEQGRMLDNIIDNLPVGLFVKSVPDNYKWVIWNRKAEELFDLPVAKVLGTNDFDHFPVQEANFFKEIDEQVMRERRVIDIEIEKVTSSRGTWLAHTIKVPIYDAEGKPFRLLGIIEDITVKKQQADTQLQEHAAELELKNSQLEATRALAEEANHAKALLLASLDSDLRVPLEGIVAAAETLLRTHQNGAQEQLRMIRQHAGLALHMLNDLAERDEEEQLVPPAGIEPAFRT